MRVSEIARRLGVSQRSLARRLSSEGLTFSDVLDSLRTDLAERYLSEENLSISQIAWLLGYQEVSALTHAFKHFETAPHLEAPDSRRCLNLYKGAVGQKTGLLLQHKLPAK